ncbi:MAG: hypothetical protein WC956_10890 [bacterium]
MKKILVVAVAMAFAFAVAGKANAEDTKAKVKETTKTTATGDTKTVIKEKTATGTEKEVVKTTEGGKEVTGKDVTTFKKGDVYEDTVKFQKFDEKNGDYVFVMKDNKTYRIKHTLTESDKQNMLKKGAGTTVKITSTYPLSRDQLVVITSAK